MKMLNFNPRQVMNAIMKSANPNQMLNQIAMQNPVFQQAMQATNGKTPKQVRDMAYSIAQQRGINLDTFLREMGISPDQMKF